MSFSRLTQTHFCSPTVGLTVTGPYLRYPSRFNVLRWIVDIALITSNDELIIGTDALVSTIKVSFLNADPSKDKSFCFNVDTSAPVDLTPMLSEMFYFRSKYCYQVVFHSSYRAVSLSGLLEYSLDVANISEAVSGVDPDPAFEPRITKALSFRFNPNPLVNVAITSGVEATVPIYQYISDFETIETDSNTLIPVSRYSVGEWIFSYQFNFTSLPLDKYVRVWFCEVGGAELYGINQTMGSGSSAIISASFLVPLSTGVAYHFRILANNACSFVSAGSFVRARKLQ